MNGFIKLHRKILSWEWFADPPTLSVFLALLLRASFQDASWKGAPVRRGQAVTSIASLAAQCGLSVQQTRTALSHLRATGEITEQTTNRYRLVTIEKYALYQDAGEGTGRRSDRPGGSPSAGRAQVEQQHRKKKEWEEDKKEEERGSPLCGYDLPLL